MLTLKKHYRLWLLLVSVLILVSVILYKHHEQPDSVDLFLNSSSEFIVDSFNIEVTDEFDEPLDGIFHGISFFDLNTTEGLVSTNVIFKLKLKKMNMFEIEGFFFEKRFLLNGTWVQSNNKLSLIPIFGTGGKLPITGQLYLFNKNKKSIQFKGFKDNFIYLFNSSVLDSNLNEAELEMYNIIKKFRAFNYLVTENN